MEPLGASFGRLGASWGLLGASWGGRLGFSVRVPPLGPLLGPSWGPLGPSWGALGGLFGGLGGLLGRLGASGRRKGENAKIIQKPYDNQRLWLLGALLRRVLGLSWDVLQASWAVLKPCWASLADRSATRGFLDRLGGLLGPSWPVLEPSWARKSHAAYCGKPKKI